MVNRLANATSPYLLQHAENPVDWWEWGPEAFAEAKRRDVPVLLSVGYAACHWCHVMAHESFEDPDIAALMNAGFVNIKVDREERPDIDATYMAATTALTGRGGWPMTVFLDHERRAFYAGTYFPPASRPGMPGLPDVLQAVAGAWRDKREQVASQAAAIAEHLAQTMPDERPVSEATSEAAMRRLAELFDPQWGGFGRAPKFPQPMVHEFLLRHHARTGDGSALAMVENTLTAMAAGGMYDQVGGGFCRYSVDSRWLIPHFEKMLYDNALLLRVYLHWWRESGSPLARSVVEQTAEFLLRELRTPEGAFAASLDADSEGSEGAYYVWTPEQIRAAGGDPAMLGVTDAGTFEHGMSVIVRPQGEWPRDQLRELRAQRPRPARDDKVVLAWNAWAVQSLAEAGALLDRPEWIDAAVTCRDLLWRIHVDDQVYRVSRDGVRGGALGVLEDYAALALAEFTLAGVVGGDGARGCELVDELVRRFVEPQRDTVAEDLPGGTVDMSDNATPSGWSLAAEAVLTAAAWRGEPNDAALQMLSRAAELADHPHFWGHGLSVLEAALDGPVEVAVAEPALHRLALASTRPGAVVALAGPLLEGRPPGVVYVCRGFVCDAPTSDPEVLAGQLRVRESSPLP
ncbi:MAG: thioredoxin domain-containing protein [Candidatus Nanopelagicales bacterium]